MQRLNKKFIFYITYKKVYFFSSFGYTITMSECTHNCSTCNKGDCKDRTSLIEKPHKTTKIKKIIGVVSGKGGVGKSFISSMLAVNACKNGLKTAIMDADILGPSIPKSFGFGENDRAVGSEEGLIPVTTKSGIKVMSINLLLEEETKPVVWRGPVISAVVKQFYTDVLWGDIDIMFIDMPPGTGDVPLTIFQSLPIDGIIVVTTPQDLVKMVVEKSLNMAHMMNIPVLGIIENMSYFVCPTCNEKHYIFGQGVGKKIANEYSLKLLAEVPLDEQITEKINSGKVEEVDVSCLNEALNTIKDFKK